MNPTDLKLIAAVLGLIIVICLLAPLFICRKRSERFKSRIGMKAQAVSRLAEAKKTHDELKDQPNPGQGLKK